ncbi:SDR family NAD(P)-dependent oxidoreductase [Sphingopyxis flava]|nr:SDR family NAD(P)-dependent oxidoreductase [Sphingopyxis flava]
MADMPVALVTGCSTGVGLYTAVRLAQAGHNVVATMRDVTKQGELQEVAKAAGAELDVRALDVADAAAIDACLVGVIESYGRLDVLINNAGAGLLASIEQTSDADLRQIMEVNFFGVWNATKAVVPHMRAAGSGRIISVSSIGGLVGQPFNDAYCASKFAVEGFMESFAPLALNMGIRLSVVEPGPVNTAFVANVEAVSQDAVAAMAPPYDWMVDRYSELAGQSFSKMGQTPDEVAQIIVDLCCAEDPEFRVATAPMVGQTFALKASDPTGNAVIRNFAKVFAS